MIDDDDYDPEYAKNGAYSPYITLEKAKEIALKQAGVSASDAVFEEKEFDFDDGTPVFELEFFGGRKLLRIRCGCPYRQGDQRGSMKRLRYSLPEPFRLHRPSAGSGSYGKYGLRRGEATA